MILDSMPDEARDGMTLLLEASDQTCIAPGIDVNVPHGHVAWETSLEGFVHIPHKPRGKSRNLVKTEMIKILNQILEVTKVGIEDQTSTRSGAW